VDINKYIEIKPEILQGKPVIKGTRLSVQFILNLLANGASFDEITHEYKGISNNHIKACLIFASNSLDQTLYYPLAG